MFETEETMEIPVTETPVIDDFSPSAGAEPSIDLSAPEDLSADDLSFDGLADGLDLPVEEAPETAAAPAETAGPPGTGTEDGGIPSNLKQELKTVLSYMDQLLESLPEDKIEEFAKSEYFDTYKKLFEELGLV